MLVINVHNTLRRTFDLKLAKQIAKLLSGNHFANRDAYVELTFISINKMRLLNKKHRGINRATDVLSFNAACMPLINGQIELLGEILICYDKVVQQAKSYGHSERRELAYLIVHGILHLLGHDHQNKADQKKMNAEAERIMTALRLSR